MTTCELCQEIQVLEEELRDISEQLTESLIAFRRDIDLRNNRRWRKLGKLWNLPLVGVLFHKHVTSPKYLERVPSYSLCKDYEATRMRISKLLSDIEVLKTEDLEHWADEMVSVGNPGDPAGDYTPDYLPRIEAIENRYVIFPAKQVDFRSMAGEDKLEVHSQVLDYNTKLLVPKNQCDFHHQVGKGVRYFLHL